VPPSGIRSHLLLLLGGLVILIALPPAWGQEAPPRASFDCAKAANAPEQVICADPILRGADGALQKQYAALRQSIEDQGRLQALRADEHDWILRRDRECGLSRTTKLTGDLIPLYVDCFLDAYAERTGDLEKLAQDPSLEPTAVSTPIRKPPAIGPTPAAVRGTGLMVLGRHSRPFVWRDDDSLVVLGTESGHGALALYRWQGGKPIPDATEAIGGAEDVDRLCESADGLLLIPSGGRNTIIGVMTKGQLSTVERTALSIASRDRCDLDPLHRLAAGPKSGIVLDLGPTRPGPGLAERYVHLRNGNAIRDLAPAIRIDRRFPLRAQYLAFEDAFVVSPAEWPSIGHEAAIRRWAKTGCAAFWLVAAGTGSVTAGCMPYGTGGPELPQPLPTKAGLYFTAGEDGLYRVENGAAVQVVEGPIGAATIAPDGCAIAFSGRLKGGINGHRAVSVLPVCGA
jgi:uncharacterized protein YecT (DUF1311 family)